MQDLTRNLLTLFVEKAHRIHNSRFVKLLESKGLHARLTFTGGDEGAYTIDYTDLDREAVEAFVLNFRFFYQYNEHISLHKIGSINDTGLSDRWNKEAQLVQEWFTKYLTETSTPGLTIDNQAVTRKDIIDTILYGEYSHASKRDRFNEWKKQFGGMFGIIQFTFYDSLVQIVRAISHLTQLAEKELAANK